MKAEIQHVPRRPDWPVAAVLCGALWLALMVVTVLVLHGPGPPCWFHRLTGVACPTCGLTRGALRLLDGHPLDAWAHNPLFFTLLAWLAGATAVRVATGRRVRFLLSAGERKAAWAVAALLLAANWAYVAIFVG